MASTSEAARAATGLPWRDGAWLVGQVDQVGVLREPVLSDSERAAVVAAGDGWARRTVTGEISGDLYAASWALVEQLRKQLDVEHREPAAAAVEPIDLDALELQVSGGATHSFTHGIAAARRSTNVLVSALPSVAPFVAVTPDPKALELDAVEASP